MDGEQGEALKPKRGHTTGLTRRPARTSCCCCARSGYGLPFLPLPLPAIATPSSWPRLPLSYPRRSSGASLQVSSPWLSFPSPILIPSSPLPLAWITSTSRFSFVLSGCSPYFVPSCCFFTSCSQFFFLRRFRFFSACVFRFLVFFSRVFFSRFFPRFFLSFLSLSSFGLLWCCRGFFLEVESVSGGRWWERCG